METRKNGVDKRIFILLIGLIISCLAMAVPPKANLLRAYPGAQGFGVHTSAGRGGVVVRVTNLKDHGKGSLREAIAHSGPKIIVFEVAGAIRLTSDLEVKHPFVTIAGQTAPPPGITLLGAGLRILSHDVVVRHLRIRPGDAHVGTSPAYRDALQVLGRDAHHIIIDHLSVSWAIDENISLWGGAHNVTISNCIISEGLRHSSHPKGSHSMGLLIGDSSKNVAVLNNLFVHNNARNPRIKGGTTTVVVNNLIYNAGKESVAIGSVAGPSLSTLVGNKILKGPDSDVKAVKIKVLDTAHSDTVVYLKDNWGFELDGDLQASKVSKPPIWHPSIRVRDSRSVEYRILASSGARPRERDDIDNRILREVQERKGHIIDSPKEREGALDSPFAYRKFISPDDPAGDDDGDGYTNIEEVLHSWASDVEGKNDSFAMFVWQYF